MQAGLSLTWSQTPKTGFSGVGVGLGHVKIISLISEPSQSVGWAKMGDTQEKPSDYLQAELGLSHM